MWNDSLMVEAAPTRGAVIPGRGSSQRLSPRAQELQRQVTADESGLWTQRLVRGVP